MLDATPVLRLIAAHRRVRLERMDAAAEQEKTLLSLVRRAADTKFGRAHGFSGIRNAADFQARVPLWNYEKMWDAYWRAAFPDFTGASWPARVPYLALSSGTSTGRTKYLPVTRELVRSNALAAFDVLVHHLAAKPHSRVWGGKTFMLGGSTSLKEEAPGIYSGDLSGIAAKTVPAWARGHAFPGPALARLTDWQEKVERFARASLGEDIRILGGVPSWILMLIERVSALRGGGPAFPKLELFVHGGVNFTPYRARFEKIFAGQDVDMREAYAASEGFIAGADRGTGEGLRLNLDRGLFFEFVPVEELERENPTRHWAANAEPGVNYALAVSSCAGLFAYVLGDTVRLVDRAPPRVLITGRTSYGLSAFGEHLIAEEIETAVAEAARAIGADVTDYSAGALFPDGRNAQGRHLFIVEFAGGVPGAAALETFAGALDSALSRLNDDYRSHRTEGVGILAPQVKAVAPGTFASWMKSRGKLGGQNKVPRTIGEPALWADLRAFTHS